MKGVTIVSTKSEVVNPRIIEPEDKDLLRLLENFDYLFDMYSKTIWVVNVNNENLQINLQHPTNNNKISCRWTVKAYYDNASVFINREICIRYGRNEVKRYIEKWYKWAKCHNPNDKYLHSTKKIKKQPGVIEHDKQK